MEEKFSGLNDKQLKDRVRYLSDKIRNLYEKIEPTILEFTELKKEYVEILVELEKRGIIGGERQV